MSYAQEELKPVHKNLIYYEAATGVFISTRSNVLLSHLTVNFERKILDSLFSKNISLNLRVGYGSNNIYPRGSTTKGPTVGARMIFHKKKHSFDLSGIIVRDNFSSYNISGVHYVPSFELGYHFLVTQHLYGRLHIEIVGLGIALGISF